MPNLESLSGLPIQMNASGQITFGPDIVVEENLVRLLDELTPVALAPEVCRGREETVYYMYNGIHRRGDAAILADMPLRYELTLIPPRRIGREYIKTHGHLHNTDPRSGFTYAEVCEVLTGTAHFVLHTLEMAGPRASVAFYVEVGPGQKIVIPPGFDHLTINPGPQPLLFADVISPAVKGVYDRFRATRGAAYLEVDQDGQPQFIPNPAYKSVAELQALGTRDYAELNLAQELPLYTALVQGKGEKWAFLTDPGQFWRTFPDLRSIFCPT
jgi:glucose-6-phosphate isomerase, archaeal